jgi:membrane glycosyltransferase
MLSLVARQQNADKTLLMPDQALGSQFSDNLAPGLAGRQSRTAWRLVLIGLPLAFVMGVASLLVLVFHPLTLAESVLIALMALLSGWGALPTANALIGLQAAPRNADARRAASLSVAILVTIRDENAQDVLLGKLELLRSLQRTSRHAFSLHVLSDSTTFAQVEGERRMVHAAFPLPVVHHKRRGNTDFKSGNIRNWVRTQGAVYDAFIILDADSEMDYKATVALADSLGADPACGLIQTVPVILQGGTWWQHMQAVASRSYGKLQGQGLAAWMGDESNYYGHNAIIRTKAFATCAGLPRLEGRGLWGGSILSHDFVEAALLRRGGWAVRLLPSATGSYEHAPADVIAHLKRDARWCLGNFQHSRILKAAGLHPVSRFHMISGVFTYLSSAMWLSTVLLWGVS